MPDCCVAAMECADGVPTGAVSVTEGKAKVEFPSQKEVFYNPVQEFNRDLSILALRHFLSSYSRSTPESTVPACERPNCFEALSASGLRSIRYAKEIPQLNSIVANDISKKAVAAIQRNIEVNEVKDKVKASHGDASLVMYQHSASASRFDVVDLDPYGSPTIFLDGAVRSVAEGGLLCVTCTDMAVLCGNTPESCYIKYGAIPLKAKSCHEFALRIVLQTIQAHATRYGRYIEPLVALSIDFYVRVFVRVRSGQKQCKDTTSKLGHVFQCCGCESLVSQPLGKMNKDDRGNIKYKLPQGPPVGEKCIHCGHKYLMGGPIWLAPIHDAEFLQGLLGELEGNEADFGTSDRLKGMLSVAAEELHDVPLYYTQDRLTSMVKVGSGRMVDFRSALLNAGYRVSLSHAHKLALKTDAPNGFVWDIMRAWAKKSTEGKEKKMEEGSVAKAILSKEQENEVSFELHPNANPSSRVEQLKRFQINPEKNWGPKTRATASSFDDAKKRLANQGKKKRKLDSDDTS